jgi:hypothetical protein
VEKNLTKMKMKNFFLETQGQFGRQLRERHLETQTSRQTFWIFFCGLGSRTKMRILYEDEGVSRQSTRIKSQI